MRSYAIRLALCSVLLLSGCYDRLEPNDELRRVCAAADDDYIRTALTVLEIDRQAGYTASEAFNAVIGGPCEEDDGECIECFTAMIGQIYGL